MTADDRGLKRPVASAIPCSEKLAASPEKRARVEDLPVGLPPASAPTSEVVSVLQQFTAVLRERPFGLRATDYQWDIKRRVYGLLDEVVSRARGIGPTRLHSKQSIFNPDICKAAAGFIDQLVRSGYAQTPRDRKILTEAEAWRPFVAALSDDTATDEERTAAVYMYVHLAEHVNFYDDFSGLHKDFWSPELFRKVLKLLPGVVTQISDSIEADQWELMCLDIEAGLKCLCSFLLFWTTDKEQNKFSFDIKEAAPFIKSAIEAIAAFDERFGTHISQKSRGDPLEELTRLFGVLTQLVLEKFEAEDTRKSGGASKAVRQGCELLDMLVRALLLRIPTCAPKVEALTGGPLPVEERQQDTEWIQNLYERCEDENPVDIGLLSRLFKAMAEMPMEEQRYRLECVQPLIPPFIGKYAEQLKQKTVPAELADLKVVMNTVLQDDATVAAELLEEVSFYPCLLDFATKRATIHAVCDRLKLHAGGGEPIRLVVPRDNVLDGVCSTLNLQDERARIEVPLEIEFRAGYADDTGTELVDEGEDQGGLRRQWLDRASRYFISSDLFMSPSEDAAHLDASSGGGSSSSTAGLPERCRSRARGLIFVPSPEPVCSCVQDDWQEQFELFGCVLGFAILYKETIPVHLGHNFLRSVFGLKTDAEDLLPLLESVDKTLHTKLKYILSGGYKDLGDTLQDVLEQSNLPRVFAVNESHCQELVKSTCLKEGGDKIEVTEENKEEFVSLLLDRVLISGVARQVQCFRRGLLRVVPCDLVSRIAELMAVKEIELMVCGADEIDVEDWERHAQYEDYTKDCQPVKWFWEVVRGMSEQHRAALLSFTTGSSQVPSGGFRFLQPELFTIQRVRVTDRYPEAHTCANTLDLPEYTSREDLERCLRFAIDETGDAFGRR